MTTPSLLKPPQLPRLPSLTPGPSLLGPMPSMRPQAFNPPPTEEEEGQFLGKTLAGLSWVGETLDKGGAAVRGVASGLTGGDWGGGLLNLIPFSDTLDLTGPEGRVYGSDLLEQWGVISPDEKAGFQWNSARDWGRAIGGFGVDVGLDPLSWIGVGLPSKIAKATTGMKFGTKQFGKAARMWKEGKLADYAAQVPRTMADLIRSGEAPVFRVHAPFSAKTLKLGGVTLEWGAKNGVIGEKTAKNLADIYDTLNYNRLSPLFYLRGLFSPAATRALDMGRKNGKVNFSQLEQVLNDINHVEAKKQISGAFNMRQTLRNTMRRLEVRVTEIVKHHKGTMDPVAWDHFLREQMVLMEGVPDASEFAAKLEQFVKDRPGTTPVAMAKVEALAKTTSRTLRQLGEATAARANVLRSYGIDLGDMYDQYVTYAPRQSTEARNVHLRQRLLGGIKGRGRGGYNPLRSRKAVLTDAPGGEKLFNRLSMDPLFMQFENTDGLYQAVPNATSRKRLQEWAANKAQVSAAAGNAEGARKYARLAQEVDRDVIRKAYMEDIVNEYINEAWNKYEQTPDFVAKNGATRESEQFEWLRQGKNRSDDLMSELDHLSPESQRKWLKDEMKGESKANIEIIQKMHDEVGAGIWEHGIFDRSLMEDYGDWMLKDAELHSLGVSTHNFLKQPGVLLAAADAPDTKFLWKAWREAGLKDRGLLRFAIENGERFGIPEGLIDDMGEAIAKKDNQQLARLVETLDVRITPGAENALAQYKAIADPRVRNGFIDTYEMVTQVYKGLLYNIWPASHVRDSASDMWQAATHGKIPIWKRGSRTRGGEGSVLHGVAVVMDYVRQGKEFPELRELLDNEVLKQFAAVDMAHNPQFVQKISSAIPPAGKGVFKGIFRDTGSLKDASKLWRIPGVVPPEAIEAGAKLGAAGTIPNNIQNMKSFLFQGGYYVGLRRAGYSVGAAKQIVEECFFTATETAQASRFLSRGPVPFWRFASHNMPFQLKKLFQEPGGLAAQSARALTQTASQADPNVYTPEFQAEAQAIPIAGTDEARTFYKNPGIIPLTDFNNIVFRDSGIPDSSRSFQRLLSMIHPLALAVPEVWGDKAFFTGRKISDFESFSKALTGKEMPAVDRVAHYGPWSRFLNETWSAVDERKSWLQKLVNIAGLGRISTYNTVQAKLRDLRNAHASQLESSPEVEKWVNYFVPRAEQEEMDPEQLFEFQRISQRRGQLTQQLSDMFKRDALKGPGRG